jgi:hypothetical protein
LYYSASRLEKRDKAPAKIVLIKRKELTMNIRNPAMLSLLAALLLAGCAATMKRNILNEPYRGREISVPLVIRGIEVLDVRSYADTRALAAPGHGFKKNGDTLSPPLTTEQEKIIKEEISRYATGGTKTVKVKATIKKGTKEYSRMFFYAREFAQAAITVELFDASDEARIFTATGEANYEVKSTRADTVYLEDLYRKALKTCIYKAFESVDEFLAKQTPDDIRGR